MSSRKAVALVRRLVKGVLALARKGGRPPEEWASIDQEAMDAADELDDHIKRLEDSAMMLGDTQRFECASCKAAYSVTKGLGESIIASGPAWCPFCGQPVVQKKQETVEEAAKRGFSGK